MKQSFFIDSKDNELYWIPNMPVKLSTLNPLSSLRKEAVRVDLSHNPTRHIVIGPTVHNISEYFKRESGKIYTINITDDIEVVNGTIVGYAEADGYPLYEKVARIKPKVEPSLEEENKKLRSALMAVVDATEDKGGQFRAWHNHLRSTTKNARVALGIDEVSKPKKAEENNEELSFFIKKRIKEIDKYIDYGGPQICPFDDISIDGLRAMKIAYGDILFQLRIKKD
jgi:hypothetical protein